MSLSISKRLVDSFHRIHNYLRISLTERCNLRCAYCMPEQGVDLSPNNNILKTDEIYRLVKIFTSYGKINKVRLTGGEPTLRKDLVDIVRLIKSCDEIKTIGITTNGVLLNRYLKQLHQAGLNSLNISLDTLVKEKFEFLTRRLAFTRVIVNIREALDSNYFPLIKINCVVMNKFNCDELCDFIELTRNQSTLAIRFIEYMPFDDNKWSDKKYFPYQEMLKLIKQHYSSTDVEQIVSDDKHDTTKWYRIKNYQGRFGFISSMSEHFCSTCNRVRLTADGQLKVCLFDNKEVSLRDPMRMGYSDEQIYEIIQQTLYKKEKEHLPIDVLDKSKNRPMILIGG